MNPPGKDEDVDDEEEEENVDDIAGGAGVLGLIQQFQKANTEGRRTTVGI
jgi:autophagy-related protein 9